MIFYLAIDEHGHTQILGTQADAAKVNKTFEQIDIPTDKAGLMTWVQQMLDETLNASPMPDVTEPVEAPVAPVEPTKPAPAPMDPPLSKLLTAEYVQNWLIEDADQREIERIYVAIGCRVGEILRDAR